MKKRFYHATGLKGLEGIERVGFRSTFGDCGYGIYFFDDLQSAKDLAWRHPQEAFILEIVSNELWRCIDILGGYPEDWDEEDRPYYEHIWIYPTEDEGEIWTPKISAIHERVGSAPPRWKRNVMSAKR